MIQREGLDKVTPNQVLGDVMTDAQYDDEDEDDKKEIKVKQEKTTALKASSSKGKSKIDSDNDDPFDDETMTLLVQKMGQFMKKRGYGTRKRRDHMKSIEMLYYNCKSPDHVVANCPYEDKRFYDGELKMKKNKKDKKEKKEKRASLSTIRRRVVVMWSLGIVMTPMMMMKRAQVMMRNPFRELLQASPSPTSLHSSTLHQHALWQSPPRYNMMIVMMILMLVMVIGVMIRRMRTTPRMIYWA
jgi:hypothetical protein